MDTTSLEVFLDTVWDKECPVHFKKFLIAYHNWCIKESQPIVRAFRDIAKPHLEKRGYQFYNDSFYICKTDSIIKKPKIEYMKNFLDTGDFIYGVDLRIPKKLFIQYFRQYCQRNGIERIKNVESLFELPFLAKNIIVINYTGIYKGKAFAPQDFIFGVDIMEEEYGASHQDLDV